MSLLPLAWSSGPSRRASGQTPGVHYRCLGLVEPLERRRLLTTFSPDRFEPNNSLPAATDLGTPTDTRQPALNIHNSTDHDYYRFTASQSGTAYVSLLFTHGLGDIDAELLRPDGTVLATSTSSTDNEFFAVPMTAGQTYFLHVYGWNGQTNAYDLVVDTPGGADLTAPMLVGAGFDFETSHTVRFQFNEPITNATANQLVLQNLTTGQTIPASSFVLTLSPDGRTLFFRYNGILPDGNYLATLPAGSVADAAGNTIVEDAEVEFFVLAGDANRDRSVNLSDFGILRANFGQSPRTFSQADFNYDGVVNLTDFGILRSQFGKVLPPPDGRGLFFGDGGGGGDDDGGSARLI